MLRVFEICDDTQAIHYGIAGDEKKNKKPKFIPQQSQRLLDLPAGSFDLVLGDDFLDDGQPLVDYHSSTVADCDIVNESDEEMEEPDWDDYPTEEGDGEEEDEPDICPMFASSVTLDGIRVTIRSLIDLIDLLLENFPYVLTEKFCQDVLEVINVFWRFNVSC